MYKHKVFGKRSLSLFMAVMMCLSLVNFTVFATDGHVHNEDGWVCTQGESVKTLTCDKHVHNADCYTTEQGELTCTAKEHQHGEGCYKAAEPVLDCIEAEHTHGADCYDENGDLICKDKEHTHGEGCYTAGEPVLDCEKTEHTHGDGCYATVTVKACEEEDHEHGEDCYTETPGEYTSCTNVVGNFLAAAAALPAAEDVTPDNAEKIGEQVNAVLDMADALRDDYYAREDVTEALDTVYAVYAAVLEAEDIDDNSTFNEGTPTSNVITSGFSKFFPTTSKYNQVSGNGAEPGYGKVVLTDENPTATDYLYTTYWGDYMGDAYYPISWSTLAIATEYWMYYDSDIAKATVTTGTYSNGRPCIVVNIEKGTKAGTTTVPIYYNLNNVRTDAGIDGTVYGAVSGYIFYNVTNNATGTTVTPGEKPDLPNEDNIVDPESGAMDIPINVSCITVPNRHYDGGFYGDGDMWYCLISEGVAGEGYAISEITANTKSVNGYPAKNFPWKCTLTVDSRHYAYWVNLWNDDFADVYGEHAVNPNFNGTFSITYYWNVADDGFWMYEGNIRSFTVQSVCTPAKPTSSSIGDAYVAVQCRDNASHKAGGKGVSAYSLANNPNGWIAATPTALTTGNAADQFEQELARAGVQWKSVLTLSNSYWANKYDSTNHVLDDSDTHTITAYWYNNKWMFNSTDCVRTVYVKEKTPPAPSKDEAATILNGKYTVKVICTNVRRPHTLVEKGYSITAADIISITAAPYKNAQNKWEVEVLSNSQKFVDKFEAEADVNCAHDDVSSGFGIKLVWDGSSWTYADTYTRKVRTECHPADAATYKVIHNYFTNGESDGSTEETISGKNVGDTVTAGDIKKVYTYTKAGVTNTYGYTSANPESITLVADANQNVITLRYDRTTTATYTVQWLDADNGGAELKSERRTGTKGDVVSVDESDKQYAGYTYAGDDYQGTVLSATLEESGTVLKMYFRQNPVKPEKPEGKDLKNLKLGVEIQCDVAGSGHAATLYLLGSSNNYRTIGEVTANTGSDKEQYPYTCTVSISTTQQDKWLTQNMQDNATKWNAEHKLLDNAQELAVTLYWDGEAWTIPDGVAASTVPGYEAWHCLVIHTTHKTTELVIIKKFEGVTEIPENFAIKYTVDGTEYTLNEGNKDKDSSGLTLEWTITVPKGTKLALTEENAAVDGKNLTVTVTGALAESVTVGGETIKPTASTGSTGSGSGSTGGAGGIGGNIVVEEVDDDPYDVTGSASSSASGTVSGSASTTVTVLPSIQITNTYTNKTPVKPDPDKNGIVLVKKVNGEDRVDLTTATRGDELTYTITVTNNTNVDLKEMLIRDRMPAGLALVENSGSVTVDGEARDVSVTETGVYHDWTVSGVVADKAKVVLTYKAVVTDEGEVSLKNVAKSFAKENVVVSGEVAGAVQSLARFSPAMALSENGAFESNEDSTTVNASDIDTPDGYDSNDFISNPDDAVVTTPVVPGGSDPVSIEKSADQTNVKVGDTVNYTVTITNNTNDTLTVKVSDVLPDGLTLTNKGIGIKGAASASGSVTGTGTVVTPDNVADILAGITNRASSFDNLEVTIGAGKTVTLTYSATVGDTVANGTELTNTVTATVDGKEYSDSETVTVTTDDSDEEYTVTYDWNLPAGATTPAAALPTESNHKASEDVKVDTTITDAVTVTVGTGDDAVTYKFSGWSTEDATVQDGSFTMPAKNVTIKGSWEEVIVTPPDPVQVTLTLSYDANGGINAPASDSQTVNQGESATFTVKGQESMTREGYTFQGWATSANGAVAYRAGNSITIPADTTLYAVWSSNSIVIPDPDPVTRYTLTINYVYEDGTTAAPTHSSSHNSGYQYSVNSPSIEGYTPDQAVVSGTLTSNVTVTVVYTADGANIEDENPPLAELPDEDPGVNIPDENPPLAELPDEDPGVDIPDEEPPLAENPEVDIPDEDVPLDATPKTGDDSHTGLWATLCVVSLLGAVALGRKEEDERA